MGGIERGRSPDDKSTRIGARKPLPGAPEPSKVFTLFQEISKNIALFSMELLEGGPLITKLQELGRETRSLGRQGPPKFLPFFKEIQKFSFFLFN